MATKNFLFIFLSYSLILSGCLSFKAKQTENVPKEEQGAEVSEQVPLEIIKDKVSDLEEKITQPKIGVILGPGSIRSFAHIGVLREMTKAKLPVTHIVGIEMGALVGSIYAYKAQPFDIEWQMFKLKDLKSVGSLISEVFSQTKAEDFKLPFSCPAYHLVKQQNYMMSRGQVSQMLPFCLGSPPAIKPYMQNVAAVADLKGAIDFLKSKGANFIVFVNILNSKNGILIENLEDNENIFWNLISQSLNRQSALADYVIQVPILEGGITDFSKRREYFKKGIEAGQSASHHITKKLGL